MGADIHVRVEYLAPGETVSVVNGVPTVTQDGPEEWVPAEPPTPNPWAHLSGEPAFHIAYEDRFYTGRNYALFWKLSGVRGPYEGVEPMCEDECGNGFPDDASPEVRDSLDPDCLDFHSHTHYTLTELLLENWAEFDRQFGANFEKTVLDMQALAIEKTNGNTDHVRFLCCYDN